MSPKLKAPVKTMTTVDYDALDLFFTEVYGHPVEIVPYEEWSNYESHDFSIKKEELDEWDADNLKKFTEQGKQFMGITRLLLTDCVNRELLPEGEYLVKVFW